MNEERVILSQDLDFSMLLAVGGYSKPSLITLRLSFTDPEAATQKILSSLPQLEEILTQGAAPHHRRREYTHPQATNQIINQKTNLN